jgi:hypothetical protein
MRKPIISVSHFPRFLHEDRQRLFGKVSDARSRELNALSGQVAWSRGHTSVDPNIITGVVELHFEQGSVCIPL